MEFLTKVKGYSEKLEEEDEEEEELEEIRSVVACDFFPSSHSQNHQWLEPGSNQSQNHFENHQQPPLMDLSLRIDTSINIDKNNKSGFVVEREHMFDKVVTPSDVGKLNRLVIPKQHAEKYFPLDSTTNDKGLILNFEDRNGKPWRFRYSYWNSSQSYVMTKGWSRFVKDKKLDAGDVVSFHRAVAAKDRLFIDWRRRPDAPRPLHHHHFSNPLLLLPQSLRWPSARHFTLPTPPPPPPPHHHHLTNYSNLYPNLGMGSNANNTNTTTSNSMYYFRPSISTSSSSSLYRMGNGDEIVVNTEGSSMMGINKASSGGATVTATAAKRLRLFGVNMEYSAAADEGGRGGGGEEDLSNGGVSRRGKEPLSLNWDFL